MSKTVLIGFAAYWFFAASPTNLSSSVNATYDGVIRFPWSLTSISTFPFCITPTQLETDSQYVRSDRSTAKDKHTSKLFQDQYQ